MAGKNKIPFNNGAVLNSSQIIRAVMSSAAEAELGTLFINTQTAVSIRQTLIELGHPQPCTLMQTDNATAHALLANKILPKALKAMDMCFHWLRCRNTQGQFRYYWRLGTQNLADYFTKHHPETHHKSVRPTILTAVNNPEYRKLFKPQLALPPDQPPSCHHWPSRQKNRRIQKIGQERKRTNNENHRNTDQNICHYKILCQNSLTDTKVSRHAAKHNHSKRCLRILRQGCVRPTIRYVPIGRKGSLNKRFLPRAQNSLRNT